MLSGKEWQNWAKKLLFGTLISVGIYFHGMGQRYRKGVDLGLSLEFINPLII